MKSRTQSQNPLRQRLTLGSLAIAICAGANAGTYSIQIPASSLDSGSRAVVAIDQPAINTSINNIYNIANGALKIEGPMKTYTAMVSASQAATFSGICVSGQNVLSVYPNYQMVFWNPHAYWDWVCPQGQGAWVTNVVYPPDNSPPGGG